MVGFFPQLANSAPFFLSSRVSGVAEFTVNFLLQGRSWYTKWITVLEQQPVFAAFDTLQYLDQVWDSSKRIFLQEQNAVPTAAACCVHH